MLFKDLSEYTLHSGGAYGADTMFGVIGYQLFNLTNQHHYRAPGNENVSKFLKDIGIKAHVLTEEELDECYKVLTKQLGKKKLNRNIASDLQARNWFQVKNSLCIYAIAEIRNDRKSVDGGTNFAIQFAIKKSKLIYVFDYTDRLWYVWDNQQEMFLPFQDTPTLHKQFAGIGTRKIMKYNIKDKISGGWIETPDYLGDEIKDVCKNAIINLYQSPHN
jgi:hypothetical protein